MNLKKHLIGLCIAIGALQGASASIVNSADVAGLKTFQDTVTGRTWLDMDNFFNGKTGVSSFTPDAMIAVAQAAGFTFANTGDVTQLLGGITFPNNGSWQSLANIMGYGQTRDLIWGAYDDTAGTVANSYGFAYSYRANAFSFQNDSAENNLVGDGNVAGSQDMGLFAFRAAAAAAVPEPGSLALLGLGLAAVAVSRKRKQG